MSVYVVAQADILDQEAMNDYRRISSESVARYGGRYLVRGAEADVAEDDWPGGDRVTIIEFSDDDAMRRWYSSPEYTEALKFRATALKRRLFFVAGAE